MRKIIQTSPGSTTLIEAMITRAGSEQVSED
jgi:hypothetical protein